MFAGQHEVNTASHQVMGSSLTQVSVKPPELTEALNPVGVDCKGVRDLCMYSWRSSEYTLSTTGHRSSRDPEDTEHSHHTEQEKHTHCTAHT